MAALGPGGGRRICALLALLGGAGEEEGPHAPGGVTGAGAFASSTLRFLAACVVGRERGAAAHLKWRNRRCAY